MATNLYGNGAMSNEDMGRTSPDERAKQGDGTPKPDALVARYWREIERYKRAYEPWEEQGSKIVNLYLDEDGELRRRDGRKFPLLWANVETLKPAVYGRLPSVVCSRRFKDKDPIGRVCAELMERSTNTTLDLYGADEAFQLVRDDRLLPGRGQAWVRHEAELTEYQDEDDDGKPLFEEDGKTPKMREKVRMQKVCVDYVYWRDFGHNVARTWAEVWLVWRKVYMTRDEVADRWDERVAARLSYTAKPPPGGAPDDKIEIEEVQEDCALIYELWDKKRRRTSWMADGALEFLETGDPPLDLRNFFPCPEPCYATRTSKSLKPVPDYCYYRDQAKEINDLTAKIHNLTRWLIVKGFIPAAPSTVSDPISDAVTDQSNTSLFVEVQSMTEWTEKGGAGKLIDWLPIQHIVVALQAAIDARNQLIQDVFQLSGIGEVLRGETDARKTRGAVELEAQTGSRRLKSTRDEMARWCRDVAQIVAEVIAERFEPEQLAAISGYKYVPQQVPQAPALSGLGGLPGMQQPGAAVNGMVPSAMPAGAPAAAPMQTPQAEAADTDTELVFDDRHIELLRNDHLRSFRIEVETDITSQADENMEKERRTEVLGVIGTFMREVLPLVVQVPSLAPAVKEFLLFTIRAFRAGRQLEDVVERAFDQAIQQAQQMAQQPDPKAEAERAKAGAVQAKAAADIQVAQQKAQAEAAIAQFKAQSEAAIKAFEAKIDAAIEQQKAQQETALRQQEHEDEQAFRAQEHQAEMQNAAADRAIAQQNAEEDRALAAKNAEADRRMKAKQQQANGGKR